MKVFKDSDLKEEIKTIHFGLVKAGETKEISVYLLNDSKAIVTNLFYSFPGLPPTEEVEVINAPVTIQAGKVQPLRIKWSPSRTFRKALEVGLLIKGEEVYLAKRRFAVEREKRE